jgi:hypothetical protein
MYLEARMTIISVRIYYWPKNKKLELKLSRSNWGFADWFVRRLKPIREQLRGPEVKGVNIVNFMLFENANHAWQINEWGQRFNTFEYSCVYDMQSLLQRPPIENIEDLMLMTSEFAAKAPWPQVVAVSKLLATPLSDEDRTTLEPYLRWPRKIKA